MPTNLKSYYYGLRGVLRQKKPIEKLKKEDIFYKGINYYASKRNQ